MNTNFLAICLIGLLLGVSQLQAQEVLPFPEPPSASTAGKTLADSKHQWRTAESYLPKDAPNIVIFMTDDAGFSNPSTFGGPIHMPTMDRLAASGISYNAFHTTAMCSPTRSALLTGRNHHRVGAGQIAELASDWDGYMDKGFLKAEYNAMTLDRFKIASKSAIPTGKVKIEEETKYDTKERLAPATVTLKINGKQVGQGRFERSVPALFTASETFDVGGGSGFAGSIGLF